MPEKECRTPSQRNFPGKPSSPRGGRPPRPGAPEQNASALPFLRNLLPKDFDTGDLLIVLLLILMAGDSPEEKNNAILTLALYLIL